jgi:hypothetical protein
VEVFVITPKNLSVISTRIITEYEPVPYPGQNPTEFSPHHGEAQGRSHPGSRRGARQGAQPAQ